MRLEDIADLLGDYRDARERGKILRAEMIRAAVEVAGIPQEQAQKMADKIDVFLDGYLVGQGIKQRWRDAA
jgi:hypothetical protein